MDRIDNKPLISIIIPAYNVEKYIKKCIESVLVQSYTNLEIIIIDDGSTDNTPCILDSFSCKDHRIIVIHKHNEGVSAARNNGIDLANGEWVYFMDSDDWISSDFFNISDYLFTSDVIIKNYCTINEKTEETSIYKCKERKRLITQKEIGAYFINHRCNALWDKLIRKSVIKDCRFDQSISIGEDVLFFMSILKNINSICFSESGYYYQLLRQGSIMHNAFEDIRIELKVAEITIDKICKKPLDDLELSFIFESCIPFLLKNYEMTSERQKELINEYLCHLSFRRLKYISFRRKCYYLYYLIKKHFL